jgi:hypothetical protein
LTWGHGWQRCRQHHFLPLCWFASTWHYQWCNNFWAKAEASYSLQLTLTTALDRTRSRSRLWSSFAYVW